MNKILAIIIGNKSRLIRFLFLNIEKINGNKIRPKLPARKITKP